VILRTRCRDRDRRQAAAAIKRCLLTILAAGAAGLLAPWPAWAHGAPIDLAFFGPFGAPTVNCVRVMSFATQRCVHAVLAVKRRCIDQQLSGQLCDGAQRDITIAAAIQAAQDSVVAGCLGGQLTELRFSSFDEAKADVARACADQTDAVMSVVYGPALAAGLMAMMPAPTRECLANTAALAERFVRTAVRRDGRALDRIAVRFYGPSQKAAQMTRAAAQISSAQAVLVRRLAQKCPTFATVYGRDATAIFGMLKTPSACMVGANYVQTAVACPTPVCGNGIKETGEQCDDGNQLDSDRCRNDCTQAP
jgi:cysteine-rich repeat protein